MICILEILLGQLPEAVYFALFMIFAKNLKEKRLLFVTTMIVEYFILKYMFVYNIWFQAIYIFMTYAILKYFYKEKSQITDIFTFAIGSIILMIISGISYLIINFTTKDFIASVIISRILMFLVLFLVNYKFYKIQNLYKKLWNRNDKVKKKMKSITFRCWNLIFFNLMFYIISYYIRIL